MIPSRLIDWRRHALDEVPQQRPVNIDRACWPTIMRLAPLTTPEDH
jgi:hypothetical protein